MSTTKPRVTVNLDPDVYAVLLEFCRLSKRSMSSFLADSASDAAPILAQLLPVLRVAAQMNEDTKDAVAAVMHKFKSDLDSQLGVLLDAAYAPAPANHRTGDAGTAAQGGAQDQVAPLLLTRGSVNQSMHQNREKPRIWLASSSKARE